MSGYAKRTDANHKEVVAELRAALPEATIFDASGAGRGFPDLVIGWKGMNFLVELKDRDKPPSARRLTNAQVGLHTNWQGQIAVCTGPTEVVAMMARYILKTK